MLKSSQPSSGESEGEKKFDTCSDESNDVSKSQRNQFAASENETRVSTKEIGKMQHLGKEHFENIHDQSVLKCDKVDIKIVDKYQTSRRKKSIDVHPVAEKKLKNYSYDEHDVKFHRKLMELVEFQKQLRNRPECKSYDGCSTSTLEMNGFISNVDTWSSQPIKQEEKLMSTDRMCEKLPINLSMKTEFTKHGNDVHACETPGPISLTTETNANQFSSVTSANHDKFLTKTQQDHMVLPAPKGLESSESAGVSKADKSCKDDLASENDLIREDPVCIYCYKKLPKDISNIIEHCRLCVYMLRPINIKYMCYMCLYNTHCRTGIKRHIMRHLNIRPYTCSICPFSGIVSRSLKLHMKTHSIEQLISLSEKTNATNSESSEYADEFDNDPTVIGVANDSNITKAFYENQKHSEHIQDTIFLSEKLREPTQYNNADHEDVDNDSNNNVNNNLPMYEKIAVTEHNKLDAIDLTNNNLNSIDSSEGRNKKLEFTSCTAYSNKLTSEELSSKMLGVTDCTLFGAHGAPEALDYCMKRNN